MFKELDWKLVKEFEFRSFNESIEFINKVANIAEVVWHHPDIKLYDYKHVKLSLQTKSENKITKKDEYLADLINKIK